ncbi:MAG: hypothetical protein NTW73_02835 [Candidatus Parcubacteria bacterium]|nr:hypothetical protein [Candidatus Parcubacteria bacterium]
MKINYKLILIIIAVLAINGLFYYWVISDIPNHNIVPTSSTNTESTTSDAIEEETSFCLNQKIVNESTDMYDIKFSYPIVCNKKIDNMIESWATEQIGLFKNNNKNGTESTQTGKWMKASLNVMYSSSSFSPNIVSFAFWDSGYFIRKTMTYDLKLNKELVLNDIINADLEIISQKIRDNMHWKITELSIDDNEIYDYIDPKIESIESIKSKIKNQQDFTVNEKGITFYFPARSILPSTAEVFIHWNQIREISKSPFNIAYLMINK